MPRHGPGFFMRSFVSWHFIYNGIHVVRWSTKLSAKSLRSLSSVCKYDLLGRQEFSFELDIGLVYFDWVTSRQPSGSGSARYLPNNFCMSDLCDIGTILNRSSLLEAWMQQHSVSIFSCKDQRELMKFWQDDMTRDSDVRFVSGNRTIWTLLPCCADPGGQRRVGGAWCPAHWGG